jgi:hypothetical protein
MQDVPFSGKNSAGVGERPTDRGHQNSPPDVHIDGPPRPGVRGGFGTPRHFHCDNQACAMLGDRKTPDGLKGPPVRRSHRRSSVKDAHVSRSFYELLVNRRILRGDDLGAVFIDILETFRD